MKLFVLNALLYTVLVHSQASLADELYRCGNSFQDTPCRGKSSVPEKPATALKSDTASTKQATSAIDPGCAQRGESAKNIATLRASGKTEDQLLTELKIKDSPETYMTSLIKDVFKRRGSAFQIKYHIEHECMQAIEKEQLTKSQMAESNRLRNTGNHSNIVKNDTVRTQTTQSTQIKVVEQPTAAAKTEGATDIAQTPPVTTTATPKIEKAKVAEKPKDEGDELGICRTFKAGIANINNEKLKGGDPAHLKELQQEQEQLKREMKLSGC